MNAREEKYVIASGSLNRMFTLRHLWFEPRYERDELGRAFQNGWKEHYDFVATLSSDQEKAKARAEELVGYVPEIIVGELDDRKNPEAVDWNRMPNGKFEGKNYFELDDKYLIGWLGACHNKKSYVKIVERIVEYLGDKIVFDLDDRKFTSVDWAIKKYDLFLSRQKRINDLKDKIKSSKFLGTVGERYNFGAVDVVQSIVIEVERTQWNKNGEFYITIFNDADGNEIIYKSAETRFANDPSGKSKILELVGTVKEHKERTDKNGLIHKQTIIQRPKVKTTWSELRKQNS